MLNHVKHLIALSQLSLKLLELFKATIFGCGEDCLLNFNLLFQRLDLRDQALVSLHHADAVALMLSLLSLQLVVQGIH